MMTKSNQWRNKKMDDRQERTHQDAKQWNSQIGKIYYQKCPDDNRYFRTIRIVNNAWTGSLQPQISNPVMGEPPPELQQIPPLMLSRLMRMQQMTAFH